MVKRGPCFHCGVTNTPLWRNGPAEKPVLCNACGSRYKSRGTLHNYLPKNVQFKFLLNDNDDTNLLDDDDYKDSQLEGGGNDNDNTNNKDLLTSKIPSKKRSRVEYMEAPESAPARAMKKFHKELLSLYRKSNPDEFLPEDGTLIEDNVNNFIPPNEIGHGAILFKPPPPADDDNNEGSSTITSNN